MPPKLYAHPLSSYCQKALIAFHENDIAFEFRLLADEAAMAKLAAIWPLRRFPVLLDGGRVVVEATSIIEHPALRHPGPVALLPADPDEAQEARMLDRVFGNYVSTPQQRIVLDSLRAEAERDPRGVTEARATLDAACAWLDARMADREWATGYGFSLADCAAAPALFYADWTHPIDARFAGLHAYRRRLLARPSFARAVDEARPYRPLFPLGAPDRD